MSTQKPVTQKHREVAEHLAGRFEDGRNLFTLTSELAQLLASEFPESEVMPNAPVQRSARPGSSDSPKFNPRVEGSAGLGRHDPDCPICQGNGSIGIVGGIVPCPGMKTEWRTDEDAQLLDRIYVEEGHRAHGKGATHCHLQGLNAVASEAISAALREKEEIAEAWRLMAGNRIKRVAELDAEIGKKDEEIAKLWSRIDSKDAELLKQDDLICDLRVESNENKMLLDAALARLAENDAEIAKLRALAARLAKDEYLRWNEAGGPNECIHGFAEGIPCKNCDLNEALAQASDTGEKV